MGAHSGGPHHRLTPSTPPGTPPDASMISVAIAETETDVDRPKHPIPATSGLATATAAIAADSVHLERPSNPSSAVIAAQEEARHPQPLRPAAAGPSKPTSTATAVSASRKAAATQPKRRPTVPEPFHLGRRGNTKASKGSDPAPPLSKTANKLVADPPRKPSGARLPTSNAFTSQIQQERQRRKAMESRLATFRELTKLPLLRFPIDTPTESIESSTPPARRTRGVSVEDGSEEGELKEKDPSVTPTQSEWGTATIASLIRKEEEVMATKETSPDRTRVERRRRDWNSNGALEDRMEDGEEDEAKWEAQEDSVIRGLDLVEDGVERGEEGERLEERVDGGAQVKDSKEERSVEGPEEEDDAEGLEDEDAGELEDEDADEREDEEAEELEDGEGDSVEDEEVRTKDGDRVDTDGWEESDDAEARWKEREEIRVGTEKMGSGTKNGKDEEEERGHGAKRACGDGEEGAGVDSGNETEVGERSDGAAFDDGADADSSWADDELDDSSGTCTASKPKSTLTLSYQLYPRRETSTESERK
ncbi:hypothetical protein ACQY0O_004986 [Thecaphora frezii]